MMKVVLFLCVVWLVYAEDTVNSDVGTYMTINSHLIKVTHKIHIMNNGSTPLKSYIHIEEPKNSVLGVTDQFENKLRYQQIGAHKSEDQHYLQYLINLNEPVEPKETYMIVCVVLLVDKMKPVKKAINFHEEPLVQVQINLHFSSVYFTLFHNCYVEYESGTDAYAENENVATEGNVMTYNFSNVEPFSVESNRFIFQYNKPIYIVQNLERQIQVSMYGKIHVTDNVVIENRASKILGHYTDMLYASRESPFYTFLPSTAEDIKFFDVLGNNSYSSLIYSADDITLRHKGRYPLFGGWKYTYTVQYYVPIYEYLYVDHIGVFYLQMRSIDNVIGNTYIENAVTRIVLPEFAKVLKVNLLNKFSRRKGEITRSCLSISGNPTVVFNGSYLIDGELYPFMVKFSYNQNFIMSHVIVIVFIIQSIFTLYLIWVRLC